MKVKLVKRIHEWNNPMTADFILLQSVELTKRFWLPTKHIKLITEQKDVDGCIIKTSYGTFECKDSAPDVHAEIYHARETWFAQLEECFKT